MTAWGRTGRVELSPGVLVASDWHVYADTHYAGAVWVPGDGTFCGDPWVGGLGHGRRGGLPSFSSAVMWVLQHAVGSDRDRTKAIRDVWRAERPVVWRVARSAILSEWCATERHGPCLRMHGTWAYAYARADREARAEHARQVAQ